MGLADLLLFKIKQNVIDLSDLTTAKVQHLLRKLKSFTGLKNKRFSVFNSDTTLSLHIHFYLKLLSNILINAALKVHIA